MLWMPFVAKDHLCSSEYFYRPLDPSLRRMSIGEAQIPEGNISRNPADIPASFRAL
ncbi:uncharacterized protein PHALS_10013 [Plasmopara halstedii]|uniref:Uncharacterized protein n=1 Tax=Plasmopara halstedii TaxID=4781 RepID=A0A0P1AG86_PLAHL|nr:uncharacterized protein PHALS_10013 [Plasmopara halstedii]CEG39777.1 hypothetical protein PHALS_10013 [Plasmopara halstedii]|eukprot:XP_024576146.1 hypothetical protein PHALS_10013 [Plasmopara halstedii]